MRLIVLCILLNVFTCVAAQTSDSDDNYETAATYYEQGDYKNAFQYFLSAAKAGNANAQNDVGNMYKNGEGVAQSYINAYQWYLKAANQNHFYAQNALGDLYYNGNGVEKDFMKAFDWYSKAAAQGYDEAQYWLAYCYEKGYGVVQDFTQAAFWYRNSAEQGNTSAFNNLGALYFYGYGVNQDYLKAFECFSKAGEESIGNLGFMFLKGYGVNQDYTKAEMFIKKSLEIDDDDPVAYSNYALLVAMRDKNYKKAIEFSDKAFLCKLFKEQNAEYQASVYGKRGELYILQGNYSEAKIILKKCLELNPNYLSEKKNFLY